MPTFFSYYIGCLRSTGNISDFGDPNRRQGVRRKIKIENLNGNIVECTLWDEMAEHFGEADLASMKQLVIIAISSCRVSKYTDLSLDAVYDVEKQNHSTSSGTQEINKGTSSSASAATNQPTKEEENTHKDKEKYIAGEGGDTTTKPEYNHRFCKKQRRI
ncbi:DNA helicase [Tanacetum coccineum]